MTGPASRTELDGDEFALGVAGGLLAALTLRRPTPDTTSAENPARELVAA